MDWCKRCGSDIYNVPGVMAWFNRDGKYACTSYGLRAHTPLMSGTEVDIHAWRKAMHAR